MSIESMDADRDRQTQDQNLSDQIAELGQAILRLAGDSREAEGYARGFRDAWAVMGTVMFLQVRRDIAQVRHELSVLAGL